MQTSKTTLHRSVGGNRVPPFIPHSHRRVKHAASLPTSEAAQTENNHAASTSTTKGSNNALGQMKTDDVKHTKMDWFRMSGALSMAASYLLCNQLITAEPAFAVLNSPNAQIARTVDAALRRSIPAFNPEVKEIQKNLEDIAYLLRIPQRKPYPSMANDLAAAMAKFQNKERLLEGVPAENLDKARQAVEDLYKTLVKLDIAVKSQQPDYVGVRVADALKATAELELLQAPGLPFALPKDYRGLPRLVGRAVVQLTVERSDGSLAFVDTLKGGVSNRGVIELTVDGYSAPITAGNFIRNVLSGRYDGRVFSADRTAVVAATPPNVQSGIIPLEILPLSEFDPVYRLPLDVQGGELPVLPLSINGAVSFTHVPGNDSFLDGDQFFMYKFDKQASGLSGLAFDEGTFSVFGYVTQGIDIMAKLQSGDVIVKAEVVSGADKLVIPGQTAA